MSPHAELLAARATALCTPLEGSGGITIVPVTAALARTEAPASYRQLTQVLKVHEEIPLDDLAPHLESIGYERHDPVEMAGEYSIRGGILDVFPPEQEQPVRIEFFGDEIESIRRFDAESQRSIHKLSECVLQPLTEFQKSRAMLAALAEHVREQGARPDMPVEGRTFRGLGELVPAVRAATNRLLDFQQNPLVMIDEPELTRLRPNGTGRIQRAAGLRGNQSGATIFEWHEFAGWREKRDVLEMRQIEIATDTSDSFHIPTRPSMAFHGNLQVAIREAKTLIEAGTRMAFFAPTAGEMERMADVFSEYCGAVSDRSRRRASPRISCGTGTIAAARGVALIRGDVAHGTVFQEGRPGYLRRGRSVRRLRDCGETRQIARSALSPPISSI